MEENKRLQTELRERFRPANLVGSSQSMATVYDAIAQVAPSDTTVLIRGESGVGKELVAHAIHHNSLRTGKPYIKVNCAALPETVIEAELFGHEKGAFTGAMARRKGRFELADGGTLFLDEVGDFSPATQVRLLRVLQEKEFERVGGTETQRVDVRIIAATNRNVEELMEKRHLPTGSLLPSQCIPNSHTSLAAQKERYSLARRSLCGKVCPKESQKDSARFHTSHRHCSRPIIGLAM